jgi:orotidine-5'-phosphate decarboxylase
MEFFKRLEDIVSYKKTCICIGLDPRVDPADPGAVAAVIAGNRGLIEATAAYAAAYKPNLAFYEALGPAGLEALEKTLLLVPDGIPVILDAKRCDIGATAEAYADGPLRAAWEATPSP